MLAENPDQRGELVEDRSLVPNAVEELLRYEAPSPVQARYIAQDVEHHGQKIAAGNVMVLLTAAGNRDERHFPDPDRFDIDAHHRPPPLVRVRHPLLPRCRAAASKAGSRSTRC